MPSGAAVIRDQGARGVSSRVNYVDADGRQVKETVGREPSMQTTKQYVHLAGVVFRDESDALERRMLGGYQNRGTEAPQTALR